MLEDLAKTASVRK